MNPTRAVAAFTLVLLAGGTRFVLSGQARPPHGPAVPVLADAAPSIDELLARFTKALADNDKRALTRLRVSEREYLDVIMPGNVPPGEPPHTMPARKAEFFWELLDTKSAYHEQNLLNEFGGHRWKITSTRYERGTREYASYTAHRQLRLGIEDESGRSADLATGSIAEIGGRFKFISYVRD